MTACEHLFHRRCLDEALKARPRQCPVCRSNLPPGAAAAAPLGRVLRNLTGALKVRCPQACGETLSWESLEGHVRHNCPLTPFRCSNDDCTVVASRVDLASHSVKCDHVRVFCECGAQLKLNQMDVHLTTVCPQQLVSCTYCHRTDIERGGMEEHLKSECQGAATMSALRPIQHQVEHLTRVLADAEAQIRSQTKTLKTFKANLDEVSGQLTKQVPRREFQLNLPTAIARLPLDESGCFERCFSAGWYIVIHPQRHGSVEVRLVHKPTAVEVSDIELKIGKTVVRLSHASIGPSGWEGNLGTFKSCADHTGASVIHLTMKIKSSKACVVDLH